MKNPITFVQEIGYDLAFLPNGIESSCINVSRKWIQIGTETRKKTVFDFPFICLAHEAGHILDRGILFEEPVEREIKAWKTAFKEFLTEQPIIALEILKETQLRLNRYVQAKIYHETLIDSEIDEVW